MADALMLADTACAMLLDAAHRDPPVRNPRGRESPGPDGRVQNAQRLVVPYPDGLRPDGPWPDRRRPEQAGLQHPEVHQATGMVIVQLGVSAAVALVRLRAYAYANDRRLRDVAGDVVARRLRFEPEEEFGDDVEEKVRDGGK